MKPRPQVSPAAEQVIGAFYICQQGIPKGVEGVPWRIYQRLAACSEIEAFQAWNAGIQRSLDKLLPDDLATPAKKAQLVQIAIRCANQPTQVNPQKLANAVCGLTEDQVRAATLELLRHNLISSPPPSKES